jgi:hypothetical protein
LPVLNDEIKLASVIQEKYDAVVHVSGSLAYWQTIRLIAVCNPCFSMIQQAGHWLSLVIMIA